MIAATRTKYGNPEVIQVREIEIPTPKDNEILIKVHATTVNRTDCGILEGKPFIIQLFSGLFKPKNLVPGTDFAGIVEAIGNKVSNFKIGDRVWGLNDNGAQSQAQFMAINEDAPIKHIPDNITYKEAAAAAEGAHYAFNFINKIELSDKSKVIVNGATGAIGSAAIQILKSRGVYVVAVCEGKYFDKVQYMNADKLIDYTNQDFTDDNERYDIVFDAVGKSTFAKSKKILKNKGIYISSELGPNAENPFLALWTPFFSSQKVIFPLPLNIKRSLDYIQNLLITEKFKPLIDRNYDISDIADAYRYVQSGNKIGNVIINYHE